MKPTRKEVLAWLKAQLDAQNSTTAFWTERKASPLSPWVKHPIDIEKARAIQDHSEEESIANAALAQAALDLLQTDQITYAEGLREVIIC